MIFGTRAKDSLLCCLALMLANFMAMPPCHAQGTGTPSPSAKPSPDSKLLAPIRLVENYVSTSYVPSVTWTRSGEGNSREWESRNYIVYIAGTAGKHASFWVEPHPLNKPGGFFTKFEMFQGSLFAGNSERFALLRGGQIFNFENSGFAGNDRVITQTAPLFFDEINGFSMGETSKGMSAEVTLPRLTTGKVGFFYSDAAGTEFELGQEEEAPPPPPKPEPVKADGGEEGAAQSEDATAENTEKAPQVSDKRISFRRPRGIVLTAEKVFGREGLSGIQTQYVIGYTPITVNGAQNPDRFQRWNFFANKTFLDKKGLERVNIIYGSSLLRDGRFIDADSQKKSWGFGQFVEVDAFLIPSYLTAIARFDQLRPTNLIKDNTQFGATVGLALDVHGPRRSRGRITFDYQMIGQEGMQPIRRFILAFRQIF
jgi:hypothetical protein